MLQKQKLPDKEQIEYKITKLEDAIDSLKYSIDRLSVLVYTALNTNKNSKEK